MKKTDIRVVVSALVCIVLSIVFSFWPLALAGLALAALGGALTFAIIAACMLDLIYGVPTGILSVVQFPFLIVTLVCALVRIFGLKYVLERGDLGRV